MAANYVYKDIDLSLEKTISKDFPIITDEDSIKRTLYNNLMISSSERYFDNLIRMDIKDSIHEEMSFLTRKQIKDAVFEAASLDKRIDEIRDMSIIYDPENGTIELDIELLLNVKINNNRAINISLLFNVT